MKTLIIYPGSNVEHDSAFYILDPETGEALASHYCSHSAFAKGDLHDNRVERLEKWENKFGEKTEAKFIDETDYNWDEVYAKNQELKSKQVNEQVNLIPCDYGGDNIKP